MTPMKSTAISNCIRHQETNLKHQNITERASVIENKHMTISFYAVFMFHYLTYAYIENQYIFVSKNESWFPCTVSVRNVYCININIHNTRTLINSLRPGEAYMRRWTGSSLVQIIDCRMFGAKPLSETMLELLYNIYVDSIKRKRNPKHVVSIWCTTSQDIKFFKSVI